MHMDTVWRSLARKDCGDSIENIYQTVKEFPELITFDDEFSQIKEHLESLCALLHLDFPWEENELHP